MTAPEALAVLRGKGVKLWLAETAKGLEPQLTGTLDDASRALLAEHRAALMCILLEEMRKNAEKRDDPRAADRVVRFWPL